MSNTLKNLGLVATTALTTSCGTLVDQETPQKAVPVGGPKDATAELGEPFNPLLRPDGSDPTVPMGGQTLPVSPNIGIPAGGTTSPLPQPVLPPTPIPPVLGPPPVAPGFCPPSASIDSGTTETINIDLGKGRA